MTDVSGNLNFSGRVSYVDKKSLVRILPYPHFRATYDNGSPLAYGKLYTYIASTSEPKATYTTREATVENSNPVVLDGNGEAEIWGSGSYKYILKDVNGCLVWTLNDSPWSIAFDFTPDVEITFYMPDVEYATASSGTMTWPTWTGSADVIIIFYFYDGTIGYGYGHSLPSVTSYKWLLVTTEILTDPTDFYHTGGISISCNQPGYYLATYTLEYTYPIPSNVYYTLTDYTLGATWDGSSLYIDNTAESVMLLLQENSIVTVNRGDYTNVPGNYNSWTFQMQSNVVPPDVNYTSDQDLSDKLLTMDRDWQIQFGPYD